LKISNRYEKIWNSFTILVITGIVLLGLWAALVYTDPQNSLNPYPPPTLPASVVLIDTLEPTVLATSTITITSTPTETSTQTQTPLPTWTLLPFQQTQQASQNQLTQTEVPHSGFRYTLQGEPAAIAAELFNSSRQNCDWMGVAGKVLDMEGRPVTGILVQLSGTLDRESINQYSLSGTALNYGPSGYEFQIADLPTESSQSLYVRLFDQSNIALSDKVFFDTYSDMDCSRNLVIINFKQVRP
jgi:hypothetical protein